MAWLFQPKNDKCIDCDKDISIKTERHYIVWDGRPRRKNYRRQCAACYDAEHQRPYERRSHTDSILHSRTPMRREADESLTKPPEEPCPSTSK